MNLEDLLPYQTDLKVVPVGHTLFNAGESGQDMYVLITGRIDISINGGVEHALHAVIAAPGAQHDRQPCKR